MMRDFARKINYSLPTQAKGKDICGGNLETSVDIKLILSQCYRNSMKSSCTYPEADVNRWYHDNDESGIKAKDGAWNKDRSKWDVKKLKQVDN